MHPQHNVARSYGQINIIQLDNWCLPQIGPIIGNVQWMSEQMRGWKNWENTLCVLINHELLSIISSEFIISTHICFSEWEEQLFFRIKVVRHLTKNKNPITSWNTVINFQKLIHLYSVDCKPHSKTLIMIFAGFSLQSEFLFTVHAVKKDKVTLIAAIESVFLVLIILASMLAQS